MHADQLPLPLDVARRLVHEQFPHTRGLEVRRAASSGTVNAIIKVGDGLAARFPLRPADAGAHEARLRAEASAALRLSAAAAPVGVPRPLGIGRPGHGFPLAWSLWTWLPGEVATSTSHASSEAFAADLAALIGRLRAADAGGERFSGGGRGGRLPDHDAWVVTCLERSAGLLDTVLLGRLWARYRELRRPDADVLSHTDLIPANLLVAGERLAGVLDAGDARAADPALDLVAGWHLLDAAPRARLRDLLGSDDVEWGRGRAWAFEQALGAPWYYLDTNPAMARLGAWTLARIVEDETGDPADLAPRGSRAWTVPGGPTRA